ncbi:MAG: ATP-binding protein [Candidatus Berkiellales bacterium]
MRRIQTSAILKDLTHKMVLVAGPRQVGKTFMSKQIAKMYKAPLYLNYDQIEDRKIMLEQAWLPTTDLLILDELHKMPEWKNFLKGVYDTKPDPMAVLVTGSARLDIFTHIGDSLAGRYFLHRLLPLSPAELTQLDLPVDLQALIEKSGFPEPYIAKEQVDVNRWRLQYITSLLSTDVFEFDKVQNLGAVRTLFELLRTKIGSPISYQSIAQDVGISPMTVKKYIQILEALYVIFQVTPYSKNIGRSLLKEPKVYFFDTGLVKGDDGAKLENLIAGCLLKHVYAKVDYKGENYALHYLRTKDKQEVDFALVKDDTVELMIEVKKSSKEISKSLYDFHKKYGFPAVQVVQDLRQERMVDAIKLVKADRFLSELML